ncbi:PIG-L deacetylase family protein [Streptomyces xiamenensis]|jgi:LmbE family N-acetylglucosaminyl deacetylase|uniref:PIG-L deacetylase family protein n=1 Tax=Streptomyces xiamenensis TaxID=408015 RepID=UPI003D74D292
MATLVAFHAHPDDEVLLTGGTLARAAAEGHRVVIVAATDGHMDAVPPQGAPRLAELRAAAGVLGAHRVVHLGYADSGHGKDLYPDPADRPRLVRADTEEAAGRLADVLRQERADLLLGYDRNGGYGHRDHVKVHEIGRRAFASGAVPRLLEGTVPRETAARLARALREDATRLERMFLPRAEITHAVNVRRYAALKQRALAEHRSQTGGKLPGTLLGLPVPLFRALLGREWFSEVGRPRRP